MKTLVIGLLAVSVLLAGCASVSLPAASGYSVQIGNAEYYAKSVKLHGEWIEIETETATVWAKNAAVVIKPKK